MQKRFILIDDESCLTASATIFHEEFRYNLKINALSEEERHHHKQTFSGDATLDISGGTAKDVSVGLNGISLKVVGNESGKFSADINLGYAFEIPPWEIPHIMQTQLLDCWAAGAAVLQSWKDQQTHTIDDVLNKAGDQYRQIWDTGQPIQPNEFREFAYHLGLEVEQDISRPYTACDFLDMLLDYGPIFIVIGVAPDGAIPPSPDQRPLYHTVIMNGILDWGSDGMNKISFYDPNTGTFREGALQSFLTLFENISADSFRPRFVHWPKKAKSDKPNTLGKGNGNLSLEGRSTMQALVNDKVVFTNNNDASLVYKTALNIEKDDIVEMDVDQIGHFAGKFVEEE